MWRVYGFQIYRKYLRTWLNAVLKNLKLLTKEVILEADSKLLNFQRPELVSSKISLKSQKKQIQLNLLFYIILLENMEEKFAFREHSHNVFKMILSTFLFQWFIVKIQLCSFLYRYLNDWFLKQSRMPISELITRSCALKTSMVIQSLNMFVPSQLPI